MRVIAGSARGRQLAPLKGHVIRPTPDRVREALFSILTSRLGSMAGKTVLDLFAGSGALGIESLSRGAAHACFVDATRQATDVIRDNLERCRLRERAAIIQGDARSVMENVASHGPFDLVFLDPPYGRGLVAELLQAIDTASLLTANGLISAETGADETLPEVVGRLVMIDRRRYGTVAIHLYHSEARESQ